MYNVQYKAIAFSSQLLIFGLTHRLSRPSDDSVGRCPLLAGPGGGGIVNRGNSLTSCLSSIVQTDQIVTVEAEYVMSVRLDC